MPNIAADFDTPKGVPIDAIIFGGRTRDREPLIRAITDLAEGVYDGLTLGAEATFAAEGTEGVLRYDPMSMRPFMAYSEGAYAAHWLKIIGSATDQPIFAHVNWFQRDPDDGHFLWPGYRDNLRPLLWLLQLRNGEVTGRQTPVGIVPLPEELELTGMDLRPGDLDRLLTIDTARWQQEMAHREEHLAQFRGPAGGDLGGAPPGGRRPGRSGLTGRQQPPHLLVHGLDGAEGAQHDAEFDDPSLVVAPDDVHAVDVRAVDARLELEDGGVTGEHLLRVAEVPRPPHRRAPGTPLRGTAS